MLVLEKYKKKRPNLENLNVYVQHYIKVTNLNQNFKSSCFKRMDKIC